MTLRTRRQDGFTIPELVLVIFVIALLLAVVLATRAGVAQKERNTERQRDIAEIRDVLEGYYAQNDKYPTLADVNSDTWRKVNMKALDISVLHDPQNTSNNIRFTDKPASQQYAYTVTAADGSSCDDQKKPCTQYTLTATLEGNGKVTTFSRNSLN